MIITFVNNMRQLLIFAHACKDKAKPKKTLPPAKQVVF